MNPTVFAAHGGASASVLSVVNDVLMSIPNGPTLRV
jgi:hypothetical protein